MKTFCHLWKKTEPLHALCDSKRNPMAASPSHSNDQFVANHVVALPLPSSYTDLQKFPAILLMKLFFFLL